MLTIFAACRPFEGRMRAIQRNAIETWRALPIENEILLIGNEDGIAEAALELGASHIPVAEEYQHGTFSIPVYERLARAHASGDMLLQISADCMLLSFFEAYDALTNFACKYPSCIGVGRRWDIPFPDALDFSSDWRAQLSDLKDRKGVLHPECGLDVIVFPADSEPFWPEGLVGRPRGDGGIFRCGLDAGMQGVDITGGMIALHQEHEPWGDRELWKKGTEYNQAHIARRTGANSAVWEVKDMEVRRRGA